MPNETHSIVGSRRPAAEPGPKTTGPRSASVRSPRSNSPPCGQGRTAPPRRPRRAVCWSYAACAGLRRGTETSRGT